MSNEGRYQFSLRDMLVLTTVIGVGICLLLMAIESSRNGATSGRNTQCKNNIRQLAIAVDGYQNICGNYPGRLQNLGGQSVPWPVAMFPQFGRLDLHKDWADRTIKSKPTPFLEMLVCPQDPPTKIGGPVLSYVANAGITDLTNPNVANGVFFDQTQFPTTTIRADDIVDGKSSTIVFSENLQATTWDSVQPYETIFVWHAAAQPTPEILINGGDLKLPVTAATARPSSKHRGGVNVAFADTHVIFLREDIDYAVYAQLMTPNDQDSDMLDAWKVPLGATKYK